MRQGDIILAAGRVRSKKKKTRNGGAYKNKKNTPCCNGQGNTPFLLAIQASGNDTFISKSETTCDMNGHVPTVVLVGHKKARNCAAPTTPPLEKAFF